MKARAKFRVVNNFAASLSLPYQIYARVNDLKYSTEDSLEGPRLRLLRSVCDVVFFMILSCN